MRLKQLLPLWLCEQYIQILVFKVDDAILHTNYFDVYFLLMLQVMLFGMSYYITTHEAEDLMGVMVPLSRSEIGVYIYINYVILLLYNIPQMYPYNFSPVFPSFLFKKVIKLKHLVARNHICF